MKKNDIGAALYRYIIQKINLIKRDIFYIKKQKVAKIIITKTSKHFPGSDLLS